LKRASSVETRRARSRSAVIKAAVLPDWLIASRKATATVRASSRSFAASTSAIGAMAAKNLPLPRSISAQASLVSAGRIASASKASRARFGAVTSPNWMMS
jgi:hypothetical protein